MTNITLCAPLSGWVGPLNDVPDPVFAERMMGDGVAIDPLDAVLRSPCSAEVIGVAPTGHSVTLRLANGAELLIHIGLETVALGGKGFTAKISDGDAVVTGTPLIAFDMDYVAAHAKSLVTPIIVMNEGYELVGIAQDCLVQHGDPLFEIHAVATQDDSEPVGDDTAHCEVKIPMVSGIHARPAARIGAALKSYCVEIEFAAHGRRANARSTVALLALGLRYEDIVTITGRGKDARAAVTAIATLIESGMGELAEAAPAPKHQPITPVPMNNGPIFKAVKASPGLAIGTIFHFRHSDIVVPEMGGDIVQEQAALAQALASVTVRLGTAHVGPAADIALAHRALLDDPELLAGARNAILAGKSAGFAWRTAIRSHAEAIRATGDALLIERIADLIDIERQILVALEGANVTPAPEIPANAIIIAEELLPSQFMALDQRRLKGVCTALGGPTSHVAILAASAGIPMLVAAGAGILTLDEGREVILDADAGTLNAAPDADILRRLTTEITVRIAAQAQYLAVAQNDCVMADGTRIEIYANLGSAQDAENAIRFGAEGCGLLRTEFLFLERDTAPSEAEQIAAYGKVAQALEGRPLIIRTLDIGGDKPVPYLAFPHEDNPALGNRGVRLCLSRPEILTTQFRAILQSVLPAQCRIMVPMITDRGELRAVRQIFEETKASLGISDLIALGVMIETPAAALLASSIAQEADFLSVGTNDLTQYTLAADRGNPALAGMIDALHPAILRLIGQAGQGAAQHGRMLGICGGVASDPLAAAILIGLGASELSATPAAIPELKAAVRSLRLEDCKKLALRAQDCTTASEVRALVQGEI